MVSGSWVVAALAISFWLPAAAGGGQDPSPKRLVQARANEELLARLTTAFEQGRAADVLAVLEDSLAAGSLSARMLNLKGLALAALGRHAEAVAAYEGGLRREGQRYELHMNLARSLQALGKAGRAVSEFQQAAELAPEQLEPQLALGIGLTSYRRFDAAQRALQQAARLAPADPRVLRAQAELADARGDTAASRAGWAQLEGVAPSAETARRLGRRAGDAPTQAAIWFERCAERDTTAADCAAAAGTAWLAAGRADRAVGWLRQAVRQGAGDDALHNLLMALRAAGEDGPLEDVVQRHPPSRGASWGVVALARRDVGHRAAMLDAARKAVEASPDDLDLVNILAVALLENGDRQAARARWEWILARDPQHAEARRNLGQLPRR